MGSNASSCNSAATASENLDNNLRDEANDAQKNLPHPIFTIHSPNSPSCEKNSKIAKLERGTNNTIGFPVDPCFGEKNLNGSLSSDRRLYSSDESVDSIFTFEEFIKATNKTDASRNDVPLPCPTGHSDTPQVQATTSEFFGVELNPDSSIHMYQKSSKEPSTSFGYPGTKNNEKPSTSRYRLQRNDQRNFDEINGNNEVHNLPLNSGTLNEVCNYYRQGTETGSPATSLISRFLSCFQILSFHSRNEDRSDNYLVVTSRDNAKATESLNNKTTSPGVKKKVYSWDTRPDARSDAQNYCFKNVEKQILVKEQGQICGQAFTIDNCSNSVLLVLDWSSAISIDDSKDCIILIGPCKGSVFVRNCHDCCILSACQQFRTRDCRRLAVQLFCTTAPVIEDTDIEIFQFIMNYQSLRGIIYPYSIESGQNSASTNLEHIYASGMSPFINRWNEVHNFTPETGQYKIVTDQKSFFSRAKAEVYAMLKWYLKTNKAGLTCESSALLLPHLSAISSASTSKENVLILIRKNEQIGASTNEEFYNVCEKIIRQALEDDSIWLKKMHEVNLKQGEIECLLQIKSSKKQNPPGKMTVVELIGNDGIRQYLESICHIEPERYDLSITIVEKEMTEFYKKQIYRLSEIQKGI